MSEKLTARIIFDDDFLQWIIIVNFKGEDMPIGHGNGITYKFKTKDKAKRWLKRRDDKFIIIE